MKLIARGAEADLYLNEIEGEKIVRKVRVEKKYRIKEIDERIRKTRTKREARLLHAAKEAGVDTPKILAVSEYELVLCFENGVLLRTLLDSGKDEAAVKKAVQKAGAYAGLLHKEGISHGDYTSGNMLVDKERLCVIDFGLGLFTKDVEDHAVDLLLFKKSVSAPLFKAFSSHYAKTNPEAKKVLAQLDEIEQRGRYVVREQAGKEEVDESHTHA